MSTQGTKKLLVVINDLFFTVKIADAAKRAGLTAEFVSSEAEALQKAKDNPVVIILDLNCNSVDTLDLISKLKSNDETKAVNLIGFVSHVQGDVKQKAHDNGCNMVMARSAFSVNLPQILKRHLGHSSSNGPSGNQ
ncbi:MAG TPA: hypothetical protein VMZ52_19995 [Bryobacteraceae bacterium]|nr:hypothetical protein [Bryobacteraceae bacterium]